MVRNEEERAAVAAYLIKKASILLFKEKKYWAIANGACRSCLLKKNPALQYLQFHRNKH